MKETLLSDGSARLELIRNFARPGLFDQLANEIRWTQNTIRLFGKKHNEPRLTAWFGPPYRYSGIQWPAAPLPDVISSLLSKIAYETGNEFNSCLVNYYRNGEDSMGWHRDNEPEIDPMCIASLSLGTPRDFQFRKKGSSELHTVALPAGSLLIMHDFQNDWEHAVPKRKKVQTGRINLTFRHIRPSEK